MRIKEKSCIEAIDGTHIPITTNGKKATPYRNRKRTLSQNRERRGTCCAASVGLGSAVAASYARPRRCLGRSRHQPVPAACVSAAPVAACVSPAPVASCVGRAAFPRRRRNL
ncbi:hypothetical protein E2562_020521 [Oryza meyeriana var. granulata]|uniref:DDE Tnp4 domain-containing protein n=1 Tax=Oryza meyeriana var. granulata TaxID=110450 RepID=A0A6G1EBW0_9ORYZ|nr:hypothetical protein E2562_020521 [Oryza meyeriana var. granulata]